MSAYMEERIYYPDGCDPDDYEAQSFAVYVTWRGEGKWMVSQLRSVHRQLSQAGNWLWCPSRMNQMRWCRFDFETACAMAEAAVNDVKVNGRTWAEWQAFRAGKPAS